MNMNGPHQSLIDVIDILLSKNYLSQTNTITLHIAEIPSLSQNTFGCTTFEDFLDKLKEKGVGIEIIKRSGASYEIEKLNPEIEKDLIAEKQSLLGVESKTLETKPMSLTGIPVSFKDTEAQITAGSSICQLPPFQNEHDFCRVMFQYKVGEAIDWSAIFEKMSGNAEVIGNEANKRTVQDTMYAINNRIKKYFNTEDNLFTWKNKSIKRNF
jgi:hypothetical protein